jgi:hypothetical protein
MIALARMRKGFAPPTAVSDRLEAIGNDEETKSGAEFRQRANGRDKTPLQGAHRDANMQL